MQVTAYVFLLLTTFSLGGQRRSREDGDWTRFTDATHFRAVGIHIRSVERNKLATVCRRLGLSYVKTFFI